MASNVNSTPKGRSIFRKRAFRPWKPALLETALQNPHQTESKEENDTSLLEVNPFDPNPTDHNPTDLYNRFDSALHLEPHKTETSIRSKMESYPTQNSPTQSSRPAEFFEQRLEAALETKTRELQELTQKLTHKENHRITLGGFLQPKNILLPEEEEALHKSAILKNELREKEIEVQEIAKNLKITQLLEQVQKAEAARLNETQAREAAEEKAVFAQSKVQQAIDYRRLAEERAEMAEQNSFKLEQNVIELENQLKMLEQSSATTLENKEHQFKVTLENKEHHFNITLDSKDRLCRELTEERDTAVTLRIAADQRLTDALAQFDSMKSQMDMQVLTLSEQVLDLENTLHTEKTSRDVLENEIHTLHDKIQHISLQKSAIEEQYIKNNDQIKKMMIVINTERNLRKILEEKIKMANHHIYNLEMQINSEANARRVAEEKAKQTVEHASKAVMQLLNVPSQR